MESISSLWQLQSWVNLMFAGWQL